MNECGAKTRAGTPCKRAGAGAGMRCNLHGGKSTGAPIKTGRYSLKHRASLAAKQEEFLNDPSPGDLTGELALMRALLQDYLDRYGDGTSLPAREIDRIFGMVEAISRIVERIAKILTSTALTQVEVQYLQARIADLLNRYVPDSTDRQSFLAELASPIVVRDGRQ